MQFRIEECEEKGTKEWKQDSGYHVRSLVESDIGALKALTVHTIPKPMYSQNPGRCYGRSLRQGPGLQPSKSQGYPMYDRHGTGHRRRVSMT